VGSGADRAGYRPTIARIRECHYRNCLGEEVDAQRMTINNRSNSAPGMRVKVVRKEDQRSGALTEGVVRDLLTKSPSHPHGIKVRLENGIVGRVKEIMS
jgi:uncharacterized repeat protein (TIGR03833 family)